MSHLTSARVAALALFLSGVGLGISTTGQRPEAWLWLTLAITQAYLLDRAK